MVTTKGLEHGENGERDDKCNFILVFSYFFLMVNYSKKLMGWIPVGRKYVEVLREVGGAGTQGTGVSKNKGVVSVFPTIK